MASLSLLGDVERGGVAVDVLSLLLETDSADLATSLDLLDELDKDERGKGELEEGPEGEEGGGMDEGGEEHGGGEGEHVEGVAL